MKNYNFDDINKMSFEQKKQILPKLAKTANKRLKALEEKGLTKNAYAKAMKRLGYSERTRFYTGKNYTSRYEMQNTLHQLEDFLSSISSTPSGYKKLKKQRLKIFEEKFAEYNKLNPDKPRFIKEENIDDFYDFLSSEQFKALGERVDSNQVIEDFVDYICKYDVDTVISEFNNFLQHNINTFEQVGERLRDTNGKRIQ